MKYFIHILVFCALVAAPYTALSQSTNPTGGYTTTNPTGGYITTNPTDNCSGICLKNPLGNDSTITKLIEAILDILLVFAVPVIVFFIILAGFNYVTARGDTGKIEKAHMALLYALIGGVLILGARVLIDVIGGTIDSITG